jgi:branched-chain amino acid transport system permease protein
MKIGMSFWLAMPTAMIITAIISLIVGLVIMSSHGFAFLILTTVIGMIFSLLIGMVPYLGGTQGIQNIPPPNSIKLPFLLIDFSTRLPNYYLMFFLLLIVVVVLWAFYSAWIGKAWRAIGLNPNLAAAMGINVFKYRLSAFVLASAIAGLMGSFYASYIGAITPTSFGMMQTILIHIKAIIGGIGFALLGPIVGSAVMTFMPEVFRVFKEYGDVMTGILLILIVLFLPNGILGLTRRKVPPQLLNILKANFSITTPKKTKGSDVTSTKHQ